MEEKTGLSLAAKLTREGSKQTFYTIRFLVDRARVGDALLAYGYFRWVDDILDADTGTGYERTAFLERQKNLLKRCCQGKTTEPTSRHENMLVELVQHDPHGESGLKIYLHNMMRVMDFDVKRRGRLITQAELNTYTYWLASAVTEAMHYFIGNDQYAPHDKSRYQAVTAAHIAHMLRDTCDDIQAGYYNIPREVVEAYSIDVRGGIDDIVRQDAFRSWVQQRVQLARANFRAGKKYLAQVECLRCRLAGCAYAARFEWLLDTIEREGYCLRPQYNERKQIGAGLRMSWQALLALMDFQRAEADVDQPIALQ